MGQAEPAKPAGWLDRFIDSRFYLVWKCFEKLLALYFCFFTSAEIGFFHGQLPNWLLYMEFITFITFLIDFPIKFSLARRHKRISCYLILILSFLCCVPWDIIYQLTGNERIRWFIILRLARVHEIIYICKKMEAIHYTFATIIKLTTIFLFYTHTGAGIFYHLATTYHTYEKDEDKVMGRFFYKDFKNFDSWLRYLSSLYVAVSTTKIIGFGGINATTKEEMIFNMLYIIGCVALMYYVNVNARELIMRRSSRRS